MTKKRRTNTLIRLAIGLACFPAAVAVLYLAFDHGKLWYYAVVVALIVIGVRQITAAVKNSYGNKRTRTS